jgi:amino-acid N-acetyltransferase
LQACPTGEVSQAPQGCVKRAFMAAELLTILQRPSRRGAIALLEAMQLPTADLTDRQLDHFFYLGPVDDPTGIVGCEIRGHDGLLRSLAVKTDHRGAGTGSALVQHVEDYARKQGIRAMYLLTTTAEDFFARRGYCPIARDQVSDSIRSTSEYSDICPASSAVMVKNL